MTLARIFQKVLEGAQKFVRQYGSLRLDANKKIRLAETFVMSKFYYVMRFYLMSDDINKKIKELLRDFICKGGG